MIPKKIHYCWFGGKKLPKLAKKCLLSWKRKCPGYEIICWNEDNFDINSNKYVKQAYESKKYAFVTDYVRLWALYNEGGIYMDTDVQVLKTLDNFLELQAFSGFENNESVPTGIMGSEPRLDIFKELLDYYKDKSFIDENGQMDTTTNVTTITNILFAKGLKKNNTLQTIEKFTLFPKDYFCPIDYVTRKKTITKNTYTIHWFAGSWVSKKDSLKVIIYIFLNRCFGEKVTKKITKIVKGRKHGKQ